MFLCQDKGGPAIGCDVCSKWLHLSCVSISKDLANSLEKYNCPKCTQMSLVSFATATFQELPENIKKLTREVSTLSALVSSVDELKAEVSSMKDEVAGLKSENTELSRKVKEVEAKSLLKIS